MNLRFTAFCLALVPSLCSPLWARGGDGIRSFAPVTALILDAREGNADPLLEAYFEKEIDFFLDMSGSNSPVLIELANLREAGRALERNDFGEAEQRIRGISRFPNERQYLRAVLDAAQGRYQQSLEGFRQLIDRRLDISRQLANLSFIGAARVFHEIQDYSQAIYHYNQIRALQPQFFQAVFEKAWSFYLNGDMNGALGVTLSFVSPYFDSAFYPEAWVVRAAAFFQLCLFDRASATVSEMRRIFEPAQRQIRDLARRDGKTWLFDEKFLRTINRQVLGFMVADSRFRAALRAQLALQAEVKELGGRSEAGLAAQALNLVRNRLQEESVRVLSVADRQITEILAQAEIIQIEILQASANQILGRPPDEAANVRIIDLGRVDFDEGVQFWPFHAEFWLDELGAHYYGLRSACDLPGIQSGKKRDSTRFFAGSSEGIRGLKLGAVHHSAVSSKLQTQNPPSSR